jgi:hypothetical protein
MIQFGYCEHEKDARNYDSAEYNYIAFDELTSFTWFQYSYIAFTRCRTTAGSGLPAIVRSGTNPGNIGHLWVRERFIEPCHTGNRILVSETEIRGQKKLTRRIFIPSKLSDNPYADPQYEINLQMLPEAERAAKADGDWYTFEGQVFDDFRLWVLSSDGLSYEQINKHEPINACHVIKPVVLPLHWPRVLSVDWGYTAMMCSGVYAINPVQSERYPAKIYKEFEYAGKKLKISTWATNLARYTSHMNIVKRVIDPSAQQNRGDEFTIRQQVENYYGASFELAVNDRIAGKSLLQDHLRWLPKPVKKIPQEQLDQEEALRIYRMLGPDAYKRYIDQYTQEELERFLPKLVLFDTCIETIKTIPLCVYKKGTEGSNTEDVQEFDGDDPYDETRYGLKACQNYLEGNTILTEREEKVERIENQFKQDSNSYERHYKLEKVLSEKSVKPVKISKKRRF